MTLNFKDGRRPGVAVVLLLALAYVGSADGLKCYCADYINGVELVSLHGCDQNTCETSGVCFVDVQLKEDEHVVVHSDCLTNVHNIKTTIDIACQIEEPLHVVKCCNETDYCNQNLSVSLNNMPTPVPTVKPGSEGSSPGTIAWSFTYYSSLLLCFETCLLFSNYV